jgi:hypothetical protein
MLEQRKNISLEKKSVNAYKLSKCIITLSHLDRELSKVSACLLGIEEAHRLSLHLNRYRDAIAKFKKVKRNVSKMKCIEHIDECQKYRLLLLYECEMGGYILPNQEAMIELTGILSRLKILIMMNDEQAERINYYENIPAKLS